jgi:hypothetical protein
MSIGKKAGRVAAGVEQSKVAVKIAHARSDESRTQSEQTRMLFDFVRAALGSSRTLGTDLSRRLRDGVSSRNALPFTGIRTVRPWLISLDSSPCRYS